MPRSTLTSSAAKCAIALLLQPKRYLSWYTELCRVSEVESRRSSTSTSSAAFLKHYHRFLAFSRIPSSSVRSRVYRSRYWFRMMLCRFDIYEFMCRSRMRHTVNGGCVRIVMVKENMTKEKKKQTRLYAEVNEIFTPPRRGVPNT